MSLSGCTFVDRGIYRLNFINSSGGFNGQEFVHFVFKFSFVLFGYFGATN